MASNQNYLYERKLSGRMRVRDSASDEVIHRQENDLMLFAEYRELVVSSSDDGKQTFTKRIRFPADLFAAGVKPVTFIMLGYKRKSIPKLAQIVRNPTANGATILARTRPNELFEEDMEYFANILAIAPTTITGQTVDYTPVDFGSDEEDLLVSSLALNTLASNSKYINRFRSKAVIRNVDYFDKDPDFYLRYLNDNLVVFGEYEEFFFEDETRDKNADRDDATEQEAPKKFVRYFPFPKHLFAGQQQPVVIYNIGAKVVSEPGTEIRQLTCMLKTVSKRGFRLEITEHSSDKSFADNQLYFCSYIAIGERQKYD